MSFESLKLSNPILNALSDLEYMYPTPIQLETFSHIMSGRDVVGLAQTGTGKTFAYLLPLLQQLKYSKQRDPQVLILVPTRELVLQVIDEINKLTTYMSTRVVGLYGGGNIKTQSANVIAGADIVVATPGRFYDIVVNGALKTRVITKLVIDEVDQMLHLGYRTQIRNILETLIPKRQTLLFSATMTPDIETLIHENFINVLKVEIAAHGTPLESIEQRSYHVPNIATKINLLELLLNEDQTMERVLVFANNKQLVDRLHTYFSDKFPEKVGATHSSKAHNVRLNALKKFKSGEYRVLIATDIIARGLDISDVSHVVNFDISVFSGDYIHRIGRTGRANKSGIAISFVAEAEKESIASIEQLMKMQIPVLPNPQNLVYSKVFTEEERPLNYVEKKPVIKKQVSQGAFHEKKAKNKKVNLGGLKRQNMFKTKPDKKWK